MTARDDLHATLRRQGMADACVLLVAHRVLPRLDLEDFARPLGLTRIDLQNAVKRFQEVARPKPVLRAIPGDGERKPRRDKSRARKYTPADGGSWPCPIAGCSAVYGDGRGLASHALTHETVLCPKGCGRTINARGVGPHTRYCAGEAS